MLFSEENLSKEPRLELLSKTVASKLDIIAELKTTYDKLSLKYQRLAENYTPSNIKVWKKLSKS